MIRVTLILHVIIHENIITLYSIRSGFSLVGWSPPYSFLNSFANSRYNIAWDLYRKASNKTSWTKIYCVCQKKTLLIITGMLHKQYFIRTRSQCPHANTARIVWPTSVCTMFILHSLIFRTYSNTFTCPVFRPFSSRASTARNVPVRPTPALRGQNDVIMVDVIIVDVIIAKDPECNTDCVINSTEDLQPVNCLAAYLQ